MPQYGRNRKFSIIYLFLCIFRIKKHFQGTYSDYKDFILTSLSLSLNYIILEQKAAFHHLVESIYHSSLATSIK